MISTLVSRPVETSFSFPLLLESKILPNFIVLFTDEDTGTVVSVPHGVDTDVDGDAVIGHHSANWDIRHFDFFEGSVDLCNESEPDESTDGAPPPATMGCDACEGCDATACDPISISIAELLDHVVRSSGSLQPQAAQRTSTVPAEADVTPYPAHDCGYDNAFAAMLARIVANPAQKS